MLLIAAMVTLLVLQNPEPAYAIRPWHSIACPGFPAGHIDEGDTLEASVRNTNTEGVSVGQRENFEVYWSTSAGTAGERDYTALHRVKQEGTYFQTWSAGDLPKTFYTTEDEFSEGDETYTVWFEPVGPVYGWTSCPIIIKDDDGPGAKKTWIASAPEES